MSRILVNTVFSTAASVTNPTRGPVIGTPLVLSPVNWDVTWTLDTDGTTTASGFSNLIKAEGYPDPGTMDIGTVFGSASASSKGMFDGSSLSGSINTTGVGYGTWTLTKALSTSGMSNIGKSGYVNFNLNYVPFRAKTWPTLSGIPSTAGMDSGKPLWIIRNGINDAQQNSNTIFTAAQWASGKNGNGAVAFVVDADQIDTTLTFASGSWIEGNSTTAPTAWSIKFNPSFSGGGTAEVYYASGNIAPVWGPAYTKLTAPSGGQFSSATEYTTDYLNLVGSQDAWLVVVKDGKRGHPFILDKDTKVVLIWD
jgi:hypothetical protein